MGRYLAANPQPNDELNKDSHTILSHLGVSGDCMFLANDYDYAGYATATVWVIEVLPQPAHIGCRFADTLEGSVRPGST